MYYITRYHTKSVITNDDCNDCTCVCLCARVCVCVCVGHTNLL